jgi:hypothetical protein
VYDQSNQLLDALCNLPNLESIILSLHFYVDPKLVAHNFQMLRSMDLCISGSNLTAIGFEVGSMAKLEKLELQLITGTRNIDIVGIENLKYLKEVKLNCSVHDQVVEHVVQQLKTENKNRTESTQIKVVVQPMPM